MNRYKEAPPERKSSSEKMLPAYLAYAILITVLLLMVALTPATSTTTSTGVAASSVVSETSFGQSSVLGSTTAYARADHSHGTPATPTYSFLGNIPISAFNSGTGANATSYWAGNGTWATITATVADDDSAYLTITQGNTNYAATGTYTTLSQNNALYAATGTYLTSAINYMPSFVTAATSAINWSDGINQVITLSLATTVFTFSGGTAGYTYNLDIVQSSVATPNYVSWPASTVLTWSGGYLPLLSTTANATDSFTFVQRTSTLMRAIGFTPDQK